jgi:hypothetical protein
MLNPNASSVNNRLLLLPTDRTVNGSDFVLSGNEATDDKNTAKAFSMRFS